MSENKMISFDMERAILNVFQVISEMKALKTLPVTYFFQHSFLKMNLFV